CRGGASVGCLRVLSRLFLALLFFLVLALFLFVALAPARSERNVKVARPPADPLLADPERLELPTEGRHREGLLLPLLTPGAVAFIEVLRGQAGAAGGYNPLAVVALHVAVGQQRFGRDLLLVAALPPPPPHLPTTRPLPNPP